MKKLIIITIVLALLSISVVPAFAAGRSPANHGANSQGSGNSNTSASQYNGGQIGFGTSRPYALSGRIIGLGDGTITLSVAYGTRW